MAMTITHVRTVTIGVSFASHSPPNNIGLCLDHAGSLWVMPRGADRLELCRIDPVTGDGVDDIVSATWLPDATTLLKVDATYAYIADAAGSMVRLAFADPENIIEGFGATTDGTNLITGILGGEHVATNVYATKSSDNALVRYANPSYTDAFANASPAETITPAWRTNPATFTGEIGGFRKISTGWLFAIRKPASNDAIFQETDDAFAHVARHTIADVLAAPAGGFGGIGGIAVDEAGGFLYAADEQQNKLHTFSMAAVEEETGDHPASRRFIRRQARRIFRRARRR